MSVHRPRSGTARSHGKFDVRCFEEPPNSILQQLHHVPFPPAAQQAFQSPYPHQHLFCPFFHCNYSTGCEVVSQCGFYLHFPNDERCQSSYHVPVSHSYIFGEITYLDALSFLNCFWFFFFSFLVLRLKSFLDTGSLPD